jgi:hypothetical protein
MLSEALRAVRGPLDQLIANLGGEHGEEWLAELKKFLRKEPCWLRKQPTWQSLLTACKQARVHSDFTEAHFPLEPMPADEDEWEVHQHRFSEVVIGEDAFRQLENLGYRHCGVRRAMQFVAKCPNLQWDHPLVVTTRWHRSIGNDWCVPVLRRGAGYCLDLNWLGGTFGREYWWLVLRKRQS